MGLIILMDVCSYFTKHTNSILGGMRVERGEYRVERGGMFKCL